MLLLLTSLIFQEGERDFYPYSSSQMSPSSLPCTGFNQKGRRKRHKFQLFFYTLTLDSVEVQGQLPSAHLKPSQLEERKWEKWRWVQTAKCIFTYGSESPTCFKLRKPWCIESLTSLISMPTWDIVDTFQGAKALIRAWATARTPSATRLVGNGGVHR